MRTGMPNYIDFLDVVFARGVLHRYPVTRLSMP